jgi:hypothetical protein
MERGGAMLTRHRKGRKGRNGREGPRGSGMARSPLDLLHFPLFAARGGPTRQPTEPGG